MRGWPLGAGWPQRTASEDETSRELDVADAATVQQVSGKIAEAKEEQCSASDTTTSLARNGNLHSKHIHVPNNEADLGYCNVWVGTTMERKSENESPQSKRIDPDADWKLRAPDAGITVIYFPLLPNPKVGGVDPDVSPYLSTWNFVYTPEEIDDVVALARANFEEGKEQTRRTVRAVYERKKAKRLEEKEIARGRWWRL